MAALAPSVTSSVNQKKKGEERQKQLYPSWSRLSLLEAALSKTYAYSVSYGLNFVPQNWYVDALTPHYFIM